MCEVGADEASEDQELADAIQRALDSLDTGDPIAAIVAMARGGPRAECPVGLLVQMVLAESESQDGLDLELMEVLDSKSEPSPGSITLPRSVGSERWVVVAPQARNGINGLKRHRAHKRLLTPLLSHCANQAMTTEIHLQGR